MRTTRVLDAWAVLAWLGGEEPAAARVAALLDGATDERVRLHMCMINLGEVYYVLAKTRGREKAESIRREFETAPIEFNSADDDLVWAAARLKAGYPMSYADAFAAALTLRLDGELVTGDLDFEALERSEELAVHWICDK